jgi:hypothetical protein
LGRRDLLRDDFLLAEDGGAVDFLLVGNAFFIHNLIPSLLSLICLSGREILLVESAVSANMKIPKVFERKTELVERSKISANFLV